MLNIFFKDSKERFNGFFNNKDPDREERFSDLVLTANNKLLKSTKANNLDD